MGALEGRICLVTGASRGIGAAIAKRYASEGAHVILVARTVGGLEAVDDAIQKDGKGKATLVPLDLMQWDKIDQLALSISERFGKLDVLVGNAGILGSLSPIGHYTPDTWQHVLGVNLTANWRLLRAFDPLLKASDSGRVIFVTSGVTEHKPAFWGAYTVSKLGLEGLAQTYAAETGKVTPIRVNVVDPGVVRTTMRAQAMPGEDASRLPAPEDITDIFVTLASKAYVQNGQKERVAS